LIGYMPYYDLAYLQNNNPH